MQDALDDGLDGTPLRVARPAKADKFSASAIFLIGKFKGDVGGGSQVLFGGMERVKTNGAPEEVDVTKAERGGVWIGCIGIFTGAKEKKEA